MQRAGNHPYVTYSVSNDPVGRMIIRCHCSACNTNWQHWCKVPARVNSWVMRFANIHSHGLRPVQPRR